MTAGATTEDALSATYHKTLPELGREVEQSVGSKRMEPRVLDVDVRPGPLQTAEVADPGKQAEFALADVMAANPRTVDEAKSRLEALSAKYPDDPRADESLGFLAMRAGAQGAAIQHFERAVSAHSKDPEVLFGLAHLEASDSGRSDEVIDLLQRALAAEPAHYNARLELGYVAARNKRYDLAADALKGITNPRPEHAYGISYTLAYCFSELHQSPLARFYAEQARKIAANSADRQQVAGLLSYLQREEPPEVESK
jgi:tetratricopeptide (TPR) repeat protein